MQKLFVFLISIFFIVACEKSETTVNVAPEEESASNFLKLGDQNVKIIGAIQDYSEGVLEFKIFLEGHTGDDDNLMKFYFLLQNIPPKDTIIKFPTPLIQLVISHKGIDYLRAEGEVAFKTLDAAKKSYMIFSSKLSMLNSISDNRLNTSFNFEGTAPIAKE